VSRTQAQWARVVDESVMTPALSTERIVEQLEQLRAELLAPGEKNDCDGIREASVGEDDKPGPVRPAPISNSHGVFNKGCHDR
jgi:hypothetical protein